MLGRGIGRERNIVYEKRLDRTHELRIVTLQEHAGTGLQELWAEGQVGPRLIVAGCCGLRAH